MEVISGVSGSSCSSTSSSSITKNKRAAKPNDNTTSRASFEKLCKTVAPKPAPTRIKVASAATVPMILTLAILALVIDEASARPRDKSSIVRASVSNLPSLAPAAKPMPIKKASTKISTPTATTLPSKVFSIYSVVSDAGLVLYAVRRPVFNFDKYP